MKYLSLSPTLANHLKESDVAPIKHGYSKKETQQDRQCLLVVGNDSAVTGMLSEVLQKWGYDVLVAENGWEGLVLAGYHEVDGMLVDMHMPIMDGRTMLSELRWLGYQTPVLMMSSESDEAMRRQLLVEGAQGFFMKPVDLPSLNQVCQQVFTRHEVEEPAASYFNITPSKSRKPVARERSLIREGIRMVQ